MALLTPSNLLGLPGYGRRWREGGQASPKKRRRERAELLEEVKPLAHINELDDDAVTRRSR